MICQHNLSESQPNTGVYNLKCLPCCARLIVSARPSKQHQQALFHTISQLKEAPTQEAIIQFITQFNQAKKGIKNE